MGVLDTAPIQAQPTGAGVGALEGDVDGGLVTGG